MSAHLVARCVSPCRQRTRPRFTIARPARRSSAAARNTEIASSYAATLSTRRPSGCNASPSLTSALARSRDPSGIDASARRYAASAAGMSRPIARSPASTRKRTRLASDLRSILSRRLGEFERLAVVMHEDLRLILEPALRGLAPPSSQLQDASRRAASAGSAGRRHRERARARTRTRPLRRARKPESGRTNSRRASSFKLAPDIAARPTRHLRNRTDPEHPADDGRILKKRLELRRQRVEPRCHERLHGLGNREVLDVPALDEHARELLGVERVSARSLEECRLRLGGKQRAIEKHLQQLAGFLVRERRQRRWSSRSASLRPSSGSARRARDERCRGTERVPEGSSRACARGTRGARRLPSADPRKRGRTAGARPSPPGTSARP